SARRTTPLRWRPPARRSARGSRRGASPGSGRRRPAPWPRPRRAARPRAPAGAARERPTRAARPARSRTLPAGRRFGRRPPARAPGVETFCLADPRLRSCAGSSFTLRRGQGYGAVVTKVVGASWAVEVTYACRCGVHYRATRWRWIDAEAMADEAERTRREGPLRGRCPSCSASATGQTDWLELKPSKQHCVLILAANQRHAVAE